MSASVSGSPHVPLCCFLISSLEIYNLTIGESEFELQENEGIAITISNVSVVFKGTIIYEYGSNLWVIPCIIISHVRIDIVKEIFNSASFIKFSNTVQAPYANMMATHNLEPITKQTGYFS